MSVDLPQHIRDKIEAGILPAASKESIRVWAGIGTGRLCDACDRPITVVEFESEIKGPAGQPLRFHKPCFDAWRFVRPSR
jgi:hypothetical protein